VVELVKEDVILHVRFIQVVQVEEVLEDLELNMLELLVKETKVE
jgi:hypothetical protein|tara:strand:+ start:332 stop:463 length:132 start_codon:yes stop_codon:yes gene_type:complete